MERVSWFGCLCLLLLAGCAGGGTRRHPVHYPSGISAYESSQQCAPYARSQTGVDLKGDAGDWWRQARGKYRRSYHPRAGAILVFRATRHMPSGHVSIVRQVRSSRRITVEHANWVPGHVEMDVPVIDVSARHNWTSVRVWWSPSNKWGQRIYPTYGFILPRG
ncbi:CHAP domain-containing protein [Acetobacteraceae bacterium ESL0709]|nr:CHAP domain-containing protein [Acetobacteraceae bacterium ESL0697]MDF7678495.1 CHAP domain-containing protein [Acetobacteraceae bacterium ESL0709]